MPKDLNFAVVGLGMGVHHCKAIQGAKGAHLAAICDIDEERLNAVAAQFDCKTYKNFTALLKDPDIDVVNIVTESAKHAKMGMQAAEAGKHLIMEKPVDITPNRITQLQEAVERTGVKCGCIFQSRMDNANIMVKKAIEQGDMGRVIGAHAHLPWYRAQSYFEGPHGPWRGTWSMDGGGSLMNQGIHTLDLIIFLVGEVESVVGFYDVFDHKIEAEDEVVAAMKFKNGALGTLYTTTCSIPEGAQRIYVHGSKGSFSRHGTKFEFYEMGTPKQRKRMMDLFGGNVETDAASKDPMAVSADGHMLIIEDLVKAVRQNREPVIPLSSARHAVDTACAIYKAARSHKEIKVASLIK